MIAPRHCLGAASPTVARVLQMPCSSSTCTGSFRGVCSTESLADFSRLSSEPLSTPLPWICTLEAPESATIRARPADVRFRLHPLRSSSSLSGWRADFGAKACIPAFENSRGAVASRAACWPAARFAESVRKQKRSAPHHGRCLENFWCPKRF